MAEVSNAFKCFLKEAPQQAQVWMSTVKKLDEASALDAKTEENAYVAVLSALGLTGGIPFHVSHAKELGATREEIISAVLIGLPAVGNQVVGALPIALEAYDEN